MRPTRAPELRYALQSHLALRLPRRRHARSYGALPFRAAEKKCERRALELEITQSQTLINYTPIRR